MSDPLKIKGRVDEVFEHLRNVVGTTGYVGMFFNKAHGQTWVFWVAPDGKRFVNGGATGWEEKEVLELRLRYGAEAVLHFRAPAGDERDMLLSIDESRWLEACCQTTRTPISKEGR